MNKGILIALTCLLSMAFAHGAEKSAPAQAGNAQPQPKMVENTTPEPKKPAQETNSTSAQETRGDEYLEQKNFQKALEEFDAAIALDPKSAALHAKKGIALYSAGKPQDAIPLLDKAVELNRGNKSWAWYPLYHKGMAQGMSGDIEGAMKSLNESIKFQPNHENHVGRAMVYSHQQKPDKALADVKAAMGYNPGDQRLARVVEQLEKQVAAAKYVDEMSRKKGAVKTASGLVYFETKKGAGKSPTATDKVKVHYHGTLPDGKVFDSSVDRGEPLSFPLNGVIPCWTEGLQKMQVGGKARLVCPAKIAYGDHGAGPMIGPGATLIFDVELLGIE